MLKAQPEFETSNFLPLESELGELLDLQLGSDVGDLLSQSLLNPLNEFLDRPGKMIRGHLVESGFSLSGEFGSHPLSAEEETLCQEAALVVEAIHAASLVVDDIQDESRLRRGEPALHLLHGMPVALNASNWLYFWPFERIRRWNLPIAKEIAIYRTCHHALLKAHFGQALDLGVGIDQLDPSRIPQVCLASLELKTGALTSLALCLGGILGGASERRLTEICRFGQRFGVALQMLDDLGNFVGKAGANQTDPKRLEDLKLRRPSWIWAVVARMPASEYQSFLEAVRCLPEESRLNRWALKNELVSKAKSEAIRYLQSAMEVLSKGLEAQGEFEETLHGLRDLAAKLEAAYV